MAVIRAEWHWEDAEVSSEAGGHVLSEENVCDFASGEMTIACGPKMHFHFHFLSQFLLTGAKEIFLERSRENVPCFFPY